MDVHFSHSVIALKNEARKGPCPHATTGHTALILAIAFFPLVFFITLRGVCIKEQPLLFFRSETSKDYCALYCTLCLKTLHIILLIHNIYYRESLFEYKSMA